MNAQAQPAGSVFAYRATTPAGQEVSGTLDAGSEAQARAQLEQMGLSVTELGPDRPTQGARGGGVDFLTFNQHLIHLAEAGLPLAKGLRLVAGELRSAALTDVVRAIADDLERGVSLRDAFEARRDLFPPLYAQLIDAGVTTGRLPGVLASLGRHLELLGRLRTTLWQVLAYPYATVVALVGVLLFIAWMVLPQFELIFNDFQFELPPLTLFLLEAGGSLGLGLAVFLVGALVLPLLWRLLPGRARVFVQDGLLIPLPGIGPVLRHALVAQWCDTARLGVEAGLDLPASLTLASDAVGSPGLAADGRRLVGLLEQGKSMERVGRLMVLPPTVPATIELSRGPGRLDAALASLATLHRDQAQRRLEWLGLILGPAILVLIALSVGVLVLAMFLPLIQLMQSVV